MLDLEAGRKGPIVAYERDARCFFDQLHLGDNLRPFFGRPAWTAGDILRFTDMSADELGLHLVRGQHGRQVRPSPLLRYVADGLLVVELLGSINAPGCSLPRGL